VLAARGIERLYCHQAEAVERVLAGENVCVVTPTASGKTLCYNLPVLDRALKDPSSRALYLFPTKALAQDQVAELMRLVDELSGTASAARADVERHLAARAEAEAALGEARRRIAALEDELAAERGRLEALCAARDRTLSAQARAEAARGTELAALRAAGERLRPPPAAAPSAEREDLVDDLGRAAERLRLAAAVTEAAAGEERPAAEAVDGAPSPPDEAAAPAVERAAASPPASVVPPVAAPSAPPRAALARRVRRLLRRLRG
jgi:hypothetical protein